MSWEFDFLDTCIIKEIVLYLLCIRYISVVKCKVYQSVNHEPLLKESFKLKFFRNFKKIIIVENSRTAKLN